MIAASLANLRGMTAEDRVTGFKGIITAVGDWLDGNKRICLTPGLDKNGNMKGEKWFDHFQIIVDNEVPKLQSRPLPKTEINLGDRVRSKVTGIEGIAVGCTLYLNGCFHLAIQQKKKKNGDVPEVVWDNHILLEVIKKSAIMKVRTEKPSEGPASDPCSRYDEG